MPVTQIAGTKAFAYVGNIGQIGASGPTLRHPMGLARGKHDVLYVANWGVESNPSTRITKCTIDSQEWIQDIGHPENGDPTFKWPGGLAIDDQETLFVTDQADHCVHKYSRDGKYLGRWGMSGNLDGDLKRPSGIAVDGDNNVWVVDSGNDRIQQFDANGSFLSTFGASGSRDGEFNSPWGISIDNGGNLLIADWGNNRVQRVTTNGQTLQTIGSPGDQNGELNHPSSAIEDKDGDIYVADWGNHRIQIFETDGIYLATLIGDANNLSEWAKGKVSSNPDLLKARERVDLEPEWRLWSPTFVHVGDDYKILIAEGQHMRVQIYQKDPSYQEAQFTL